MNDEPKFPRHYVDTFTRDSGIFTPMEIDEANRRHDRTYGWSFLWPGIYTNALRLPETVVGKLDWA